MTPPPAAVNEIYQTISAYVWLYYWGPSDLKISNLQMGDYYSNSLNSSVSGLLYHDNSQQGCTLSVQNGGSGELSCIVQVKNSSLNECAAMGITSKEKYCLQYDLSHFFLNTKITAASVGFTIGSNFRGPFYAVYNWSQVGALIAP